MTFHPDSLPDLAGKVYVVTGGNSGIGYHTVARLTQYNARVYLCARSPTKGAAAIARIKAQHPTADVVLLEIDHMSLASVVAAATCVLEKEPALHGLVNNAGIMATPFARSADGHEAQWQTNYLAHWLLTARLLPLLQRTAATAPAGTVRIVNVSSSGHFGAPKGGIHWADTALPAANGFARYGQSKLANILHAKTLHGRHGPGSAATKAGEGEIWTAVVHPGLVDSNLGEAAEMSRLLRAFFGVYGKLGGRVDGDQGAWTSVFCVASPEMKREQSGTYFQRIAEAGWQSGMAKDATLAVKLEEWTVQEMKKGGWIEG